MLPIGQVTLSIPKSCCGITASILLGLLLWTGCDNTIEPYSEQGAYSIHGVLFPERETQFIRVKPLTTPISKVDSSTVDATVTLENVTKGTTTVLEDSIIAYEDAENAVVTHNFWTEFPITPKTKYRITVEGPAGGPTRGTTVTPTSTDATVTPRHGACDAEYTVLFEDVDDFRRIEASWEVLLEGMPALFRRGKWSFFWLHNTYRNRDGKIAVTFAPQDTLVSLYQNLTSIRPPPPLPDSLSKECWSPNPCAVLSSNELRVRYTYLGPEWYGNVPEDSLRYDPLQSHDVSGGLGFFGSARRDRVLATIDTSDFVWDPTFFCQREPPGS